MRIVYLGTGPFAIPTLHALVDAKHEVVAVVTRPDRQGPSRKKQPAVPMRDAAEALGIPRHAPADINADAGVELLTSLQPELLMVCDYGQILSRAALATAPLGGINLHGSLLPKYRGAAPVHWAIYNGDEETGVSVIHMTAKLDGGPILTERRTPIDSEETTETLEPRLAEIGTGAVLEAIGMLAQWDGESQLGVRQDASQTTKAPRLHKSQGAVDWSQTADQLHNQIRAFQPWPGSFTFWHDEKQNSGKQNSMRLMIRKTRVIESDDAVVADPGVIVQADANMLAISTGKNLLQIVDIQPAGKRVLTAAEFLNGCRLKIGDRLTSAE